MAPKDELRDCRTPSEHDCDRILYSDELRRLGEVTQVVAVGERPLFHTRLTHSLKVQQLSRRIAEDLTRSRLNELPTNLDVSAAEAAGLAHDLGHPPFGHIGEATLNRACADHGLDGYEGNAQTLRVLTKLAGSHESPGLGLSDATLRAVIKYPWLKEGDHIHDKKWNAYPTERLIFDRVTADSPPESQSIEAAIMDWSDDITYAIHDTEDFIRSGHIPIYHLCSDEEEFSRFRQAAWNQVGKKVQSVSESEASAAFSEILVSLFGQIPPVIRTADELRNVRQASKLAINRYVGAIRGGTREKPIEIDESVRAEVEFFKQLTWYYVIHDPRLSSAQIGQMAAVRQLFDAVHEWLGRADRNSGQLPPRLAAYMRITEIEVGDEKYTSFDSRAARAAADYIASLTEPQAIDLHARLITPQQSSVLEPWVIY